MAARHAEVTGLDARQEPRDEVHYRARALTPDGRITQILLVNVSAGGLRLRSELDCEPGDRFRVTLPVVGVIEAQVRWSLGGRIGCQFVRPIAPADYGALLSALGGGR